MEELMETPGPEKAKPTRDLMKGLRVVSFVWIIFFQYVVLL